MDSRKISEHIVEANGDPKKDRESLILYIAKRYRDPP